MIYILLLLSVLFTAPLSANAADSDGCGPIEFTNPNNANEKARWEPTEPNGCDYDPNDGLYCPGYTSNWTYVIRGYHPYDNMDSVYTYEELVDLNYNFDDICEPNIKQEDIPDPNGGDPLGICYRVYHYNEDRFTGNWSSCFPVSATKPEYHYETTDTFSFTTHISYATKTGYLYYGEIVANTADCADKFEEYVESFPNTKCDGEIKGQMYWRSENGGYWDAADCTCNYTTTLNWFSTSKADIACKLSFNTPGTEVTSYSAWYDPTDQNESDDYGCYVTQAHACKAGYCIPPDTNGTQCTQAPAGHYHDNDTDTQCQPCPAGTTSDEGSSLITQCYMSTASTTGTLFKDNFGNFSLDKLTNSDIPYKQ